MLPFVFFGMNADKYDRNADVPRALVRDMYTKSWSAFDRLVAIVPPGGSIGFVNPEHSTGQFSLMLSLTDSMTSFSASGSYKATASLSPTSRVSSGSKPASK